MAWLETKVSIREETIPGTQGVFGERSRYLAGRRDRSGGTTAESVTVARA